MIQLPSRSLIKTVSFKLFSITTGWLIAYFLTKDKVLSTELVIITQGVAMCVYYIHERIWAKQAIDKKLVIKTVSWKFVIVPTSFITSWLVTGSLGTASLYVIIKQSITAIIYFIHEKVWSKIPIGVK